jgi:predicted dehydrogenase
VVFFDVPSADSNLIEQHLRAGKHVLMSADAWGSSEKLQTLSEAARQAGVQFALANLDRYLPSRQLIRQQLDAGKLGEPGLIRVHRWRSGTAAVSDAHGVPGPLLRDLDLVLWFFERTPNLVYAVEQSGYLQIHLGFPGGGMALLDTTSLPGGDYYSLSLIGSDGAAYADDHQNMHLHYKSGSPRAVLAEEGYSFFAAAVQEFVDALNVARDLSPQVHAWQNALAVAAAVRQSLQLRRAVEPEGGC